MAMLLITHDLGVVAETADRVVVMYAGQKVEEGRVEDVFPIAAPSLHRRTLAGLPLRSRPRCCLRKIQDRCPAHPRVRPVAPLTAMLPRDQPLLRRPSSSSRFRTRPRCCLHPAETLTWLNGPVLEVRGLVAGSIPALRWPLLSAEVAAVDGVSFELRRRDLLDRR